MVLFAFSVGHKLLADQTSLSRARPAQKHEHDTKWRQQRLLPRASIQDDARHKLMKKPATGDGGGREKASRHNYIHTRGRGTSHEGNAV